MYEPINNKMIISHFMKKSVVPTNKSMRCHEKICFNILCMGHGGLLTYKANMLNQPSCHAQCVTKEGKLHLGINMIKSAFLHM